MTLTEKQINTIADCPFNGSLTRFSQTLSHLEGSNEAWRTDVATVLPVLIASPTAYNLASPDEGVNVAIKLLSILQHVRGGLLKFDHFRPLINAVATDSPDTDVWAAS
ncbi:serine/threonine-protein kinase Sgk2 [Beauveria bassiana ARSEF 2860]|uniref:Serine/threonine-protein kinase Sgk2 n=1 Tax=Beauveria bassiana (strain ARSEF 2860) TaxID=655819 RepID=J4KKR4_BEAB2|nr:serine/threonine-protein kinase Sgk2 [Beauveria bassiana ARSEF 2860]EJP60909.1 serine/threonine-protein kinase Sgk2 [Beauveria bassiana ARSEF 2860]